MTDREYRFKDGFVTFSRDTAIARLRRTGIGYRVVFLDGRY
jgi:hypothetical protein